MPAIDYDAFRAKSWAERISVFNAISAEERAELVRTHVATWLRLHRAELNEEQIAMVEENIAFISPDLYASPRNEALVARFLDLERRTATLLTREQVRDALTMHWER